LNCASLKKRWMKTPSQRRIRQADGSQAPVSVEDYAHRLFRERVGIGITLPPAFVAAPEVAPEGQLDVQAALQRHVDNAISKTVSVPASCAFADFRDIYQRAYALGLKGCAAFRQILSPAKCSLPIGKRLHSAAAHPRLRVFGADLRSS